MRISTFHHVTQAHDEFQRVYTSLGRTMRKVGAAGFTLACNFHEVRGFGSARLFILGPTSLTVEGHNERLLDGLLESWIRGDGNEQHTESANAVSCQLWLVIPHAKGTVGVMLPGDATKVAWMSAMQTYLDKEHQTLGFNLESDVVKASHHGARSGSSDEIWRTCLKQGGKVVISAGGHRGYGHPHPLMIGQVMRRSATLYCTNWCPHDSATSPQMDAFALAALQAAEIVSGVSSTTAVHGAGTYFGTCTFMIQRTGTVEFQPERECRQQCRYHLAPPQSSESVHIDI